ncbi:MAG: amino acid adenylation domain-containing protein, partial [Bacteroidetes bacterium]|nr:amino acid adenylation domain-containing protein [Bacteroidota bacterium]
EDNILPKDLFLGAYLYSLSILSFEKDITIGLVSHRRPLVEDGDGLLGCFLNTLPFRFNMLQLQEKSWVDYIRLIAEKNKELRGKDRLSLPDISRITGETKQDENPFEDNPFFDTLFNFTDFHVLKDISINPTLIQGKRQLELANFFSVTNTFLDFSVDLTGKDLAIIINLSRTLTSQRTLDDLIGYFDNFLNSYLENPNKTIDSRNVISKIEQQKLLVDFNDTDYTYPTENTVINLFQKQVQNNPTFTAIVFQDKQLTYKELDQKSNQLAHLLIESGVQKEQLVPICLPRSMEMIIGILGILKAGAAYVPIDLDLPAERIKFILEDTKSNFVLSTVSTSKQHNLDGINIPLIDLESVMLWKRYPKTKVNVKITSDNLAYTIYTSGSTGKPKGVLVPNKAIVRLYYWSKLELPQATKTLQASSISFDAATFEIWCSLLSGQQLILYPDTKLDVTTLNSLIKQQEIDTIWLTSALFDRWAKTNIENLPLRYILSGGDVVSPETVETVSSILPQATMINGYGPTENTTFSCYYKVNPEIEIHNSLPIGKPLTNSQAYILSEDMSLVPIGVVGELCVSGAGLARGYLNREQLTKEKFIQHPFCKGERLYKTGDMARWLPDGNIEFIGRKDDQVKISGYRIELGEIQHVLSNIDGIKQSFVLAKERQTNLGGVKYLIGYYILDPSYVSSSNLKILESWENLYDSEYKKPINQTITESDFTGWNSYIFKKPIPLQEMEAWRNSIINLLRTLNLNNVLEIGVGTGLLMYPLLNDIEKFVGLDLSKQVIDRHKKNLENKSQNVEFHHLRADEIDQLHKNERFDTIIINSVCQYFPSIQYFEEVIDKAINKLSDNGSIFLGDVRNYKLHKELIKEKLDFEREDYSEQDVEKIALKENELLIGPSYFKNLKKRYSNLNIDVFERGDNYSNELSKYRYDVVISLQNDISKENHSLDTKGIKSNELIGLTKNYNIPFLNQLSK